MLQNTPWLTQEAILFLSKFLKNTPDAKILEFGSGASTIWFAAKTKNLLSIEHNPEWYARVSSALKDNNYSIDYRFSQKNYYNEALSLPEAYFDLILIDGQNRLKCAENSLSKLKAGGVLMLDNSERARYVKIYELLKYWKLTESTQIEPEKHKSYPGKKTSWWIKPN